MSRGWVGGYRRAPASTGRTRNYTWRMERFDHRAHFERSDELPPLPEPRQTPVFGRAALAVALIAVLLYALTGAQGFPTPAGSLTARQVVSIAGPLLGIALAVTSLFRRERKGPAIATLCIVVVAPLLFIGIVLLAWWGYGQGLGN